MRTMNIVSEDNYEGFVYPGDVFSVYLKGENVNDATHGGKAFDVYEAVVNSSLLSHVVVAGGSSDRVDIGNMTSGQSNLTTFNFSALSVTPEGQPEIVKINLSDFSGYYNDTIVFKMNVVNLSVNDVGYNNRDATDGRNRVGDTVVLKANVTGNATDLNVNFTVSYFNHTSGQREEKNITAVYYSGVLYNFKADFVLPFSGPYNVSVTAEAGKVAKRSRMHPSQEFDFFVEYGKPKVEFINPLYPNDDFYYILENQTFPFKINITAVGGDLVNAVIKLNTTNTSVMLYNNSAYTKNLGNITEGTTITLTDGNITTLSSHIGTWLESNATVTTWEYNRTATFETLFEHYIIPPRIFVLDENVNVTNNVPLEVRYAGLFDGSQENSSEVNITITPLLNSTFEEAKIMNIPNIFFTV